MYFFLNYQTIRGIFERKCEYPKSILYLIISQSFPFPVATRKAGDVSVARWATGGIQWQVASSASATWKDRWAIFAIPWTDNASASRDIRAFDAITAMWVKLEYLNLFFFNINQWFSISSWAMATSPWTALLACVTQPDLLRRSAIPTRDSVSARKVWLDDNATSVRTLTLIWQRKDAKVSVMNLFYQKKSSIVLIVRLIKLPVDIVIRNDLKFFLFWLFVWYLKQYS